jgi:hypothetical protein
MNIPFTATQFFEVMKSYNNSIYPLQYILCLLAALIIILSFLRSSEINVQASLVISYLWLWMGIVYHWFFFSEINPAAYVFSIAFIVQGLLFLYAGVIRKELSFGYIRGVYGNTGAIFLVYALIIYPVLSHFLGHRYPFTPTFGLPCPTTIFTFGMLLWTSGKIPAYLLIIPVLWSLIGTSAAFNFGMKEDFGLLISSLITTILLIRRRKNYTKVENILPEIL